MIRDQWLIYYLHDKELKAFLKAYARGKLIDIGCGGKPYQDLYSPYVSYCFGVDHKDSLHGLSRVDVAATAYVLPLRNCSVDTALSTAVLEHLEEPAKALAEIFRILKPGGILIISAPLFWRLHEVPRDFYRYTEYGLRYLLTKTGFQIVQLKPLSGFWVMLGAQLVSYLRKCAGHFSRPIVLFVRLLEQCIQIVSFILNSIHKDETFTLTYMVVARKALGKKGCTGGT